MSPDDNLKYLFLGNSFFFFLFYSDEFLGFHRNTVYRVLNGHLANVAEKSYRSGSNDSLEFIFMEYHTFSGPDLKA